MKDEWSNGSGSNNATVILIAAKVLPNILHPSSF